MWESCSVGMVWKMKQRLREDGDGQKPLRPWQDVTLAFPSVSLPSFQFT